MRPCHQAHFLYYGMPRSPIVSPRPLNLRNSYLIAVRQPSETGCFSPFTRRTRNICIRSPPSTTVKSLKLRPDKQSMPRTGALAQLPRVVSELLPVGNTWHITSSDPVIWALIHYHGSRVHLQYQNLLFSCIDAVGIPILYMPEKGHSQS